MVNLSIIKKKIEEFLAPKEKVSVGMVMAEIPNSVKQ